MKLGHISDLHVLELDQPRPLQFLNKRLVGGTNLLLNRSKSHSERLVEVAIDRLVELDVDHIAISGDLTNLALDSEFAAAARIIARIPGAEERVSVVPGNHDYYTAEAVRARRFETHMAPYLRTDLPAFQLSTGYPFCKLLDGVALIGLNSGVATPWMFATGRVDADELEAARALLETPQVRERFKVVMVHHPPIPVDYHRIEYNRRLINAETVLTTLRRHDVDLVIHGHTHHHHTLRMPKLGSPGTTFICEAGSTSVESHPDPFRVGKFNIYDIEDGRLARIETYKFDPLTGDFVPWREQTAAEWLEPAAARTREVR